jgi:hypothetical protein
LMGVACTLGEESKGFSRPPPRCPSPSGAKASLASRDFSSAVLSYVSGVIAQ